MCLDLISILNRFTEEKSLEKKEEKSMIVSGLVGLLCLLTPLKKDSHDSERGHWLRDKEQAIGELLRDESAVFKQFLIGGLMNSGIGLVRFSFRNFYSFLLENLTSFQHKNEFLKLLIQTILKNEEEDVHMLIDLAGNLFNDILKHKKAEEGSEEVLDIDFKKLFWEFFHKFEGHKSREVRFGDPVDFTLVSSLSFMEKILKTDPEILEAMDHERKKKLVLNLLKECLFNVNLETIEYDNLKCKTKSSREAALNLLSCLAKNDIKMVIFIFLKGLSALADHIPVLPSSSRSYSMLLEFEKKSSLGFLGIKNLGCICYMISMLQQFFCTETFTRGILMANDYVDVKMSEVKNRQVDDNVFHQFQTMFGFLQNSHRREYNPLDFCLSYKDYGGEPVNISLQQDAQEFLNCIFDRLESSLKKTPFKGILDSVYSGTKIHLIECKGCGYIRTNKEIFYNLSLEVKGLKNMSQSFKKLIEPETISDFLCDNCKKKCDISKCSYLKTVPNVLIVHLKKMIFDLDFMANIKIGTRYEFPKKLNLKDYIVRNSHLKPKKENAEEAAEEFVQEQTGDAQEQDAEEPEAELLDEDFEYKLVGVVIHKGTAEWGHYVSLIDANRGKDDEKWLLFDDGQVSEFKMENFDEECFGSSSTNAKEDYTQNLYEITDTFAGASKSAYILVYDKIKKSKLHFEFNEENIKEKDFIVQNLIDKQDFKFEDNVLETGFYNLGKYVPPQILGKIQQDNKQFVLEQQLFSTPFLGFFADLLIHSELPIVMVDFLDGYYQLPLDPFDKSNYKVDSEGKVPALPQLTKHQEILVKIFSKTLHNYYFKLYCNSNELYKLQAVEKFLERVFILDPSKALEFLCFQVKNNLNKIFHLIISNTETIIRSSVAELVASCLQVVMKCMNIDLLKEPETMNNPELIVKEIIEKYLNVLNHMENSNNYKKLPQFFYMFYRSLNKNYRLQDFLIEKQYVNDLYQFYISKIESKTYSKDAHERAMNYLLGILCILFRRLKLKYFRHEKNGKFYRNLFANFLDSGFFKKLLKEDYYFSNFEFTKQLVFLACEDNELLSIKVISECLEGIQTSGTNDIMPYMESIQALLCIHDKLINLRIKCIFGVARLEETKLKPRGNQFYIFGLAKENNLNKSVYSYATPILKQKSLIQMMLDKYVHFREWVSVVLSIMISSMYMNDFLFSYLLKLPNPNYNSGHCLDWIWKFAKEVDAGNNITYSIMRQELQYFYLRKFKEKVNDFIVWARYKLGISKTPQVVLFEEDWEVDWSKYQYSGALLQIPEEHRTITSPVLTHFGPIIDKFMARIQQERAKEVSRLYLEQENPQPSQEPVQPAPKEDQAEVIKVVGVSDSEGSTDSTHIPNAPPLKSASKYSGDLDVTPESDNEVKIEWLNKFNRVLFSADPQFMIGKSLACRTLKKVDLYSVEEMKYNSEYEEEKVTSKLQLKVDVQQVLTRVSLPLGSEGNMSIPASCVHNKNYLRGQSKMQNKSFARFVRDKTQTDEEAFKNSDIQPYFHEIGEIKQTGKQDYSGIGNDYAIDYEDRATSVEGARGEAKGETLSETKDRIQSNDNVSPDNPSATEPEKNCNDNPTSDNVRDEKNRVENIIRIGISNRTEQSFFVKLEYNKIEDIDFTGQILQRGYYEGSNPDELIWSDNDAYSEDDTLDEENYNKRVSKNHRTLGCKIFRRQKELARIKKVLSKNYVVTDQLKGVSFRKKDMPVTYIRKREDGRPFGDIVIKVSWIKTEKTGLKSLERNLGAEWDWKLVRLRLPE